MLKSFRTVSKALKKNTSSLFGEKISNKYFNSVHGGKLISYINSDLNIVHKSMLSVYDNSSELNSIIISVLSLLNKIGNLMKNGYDINNNLMFNIKMSLDYYMDILKQKDYKQYFRLNKLFLRLSDLTGTHEIAAYCDSIENDILLLKNIINTKLKRYSY